jgi:uncharacterized membrane protein
LKQVTRSRISLLAILLAGTALRLFRLGAESLWYDETVSTYLAGSPLPELIRHTALDIHPPGYYILLRGWLLLTGYGDGRSDPAGHGLEWSGAFLSLFFGVLLIALVYALARRLLGGRVALVAAALASLSPYNVWYGQEVRMYTLGSALGVLAVWGMVGALGPRRYEGERGHRAPSWSKYVLYTVSAALGLYTLYYFAFLLIPLNLWAMWRAVKMARVRAWLLSNLGVIVLYAPWIPTAWRQATRPPVPPWRAAPDLPRAVAETWEALVLGQSAQGWLWPVLLFTAAVYAAGLWSIARHSRSSAALLLMATFGPLALILGVSLLTPLYHVRYMFTYSPAFYIVLSAGILWIARPSRSPRLRREWRPGKLARIAAPALVMLWIAAAAFTLRAYWVHAAFRPDDHRAAVQDLQAAWRPGDVVLVNAGWAYTALVTYWDGAIAGRYRITDPLPRPRDDGALVMVTTGHVDGAPGLGWDDPRSDFFAMPTTVAGLQVAELFRRFPRVWHYRIYDTVNDPRGQVRESLAQGGRLVADRIYYGEAYTRLEGYASPHVAWQVDQPAADFGPIELAWRPVTGAAEAGETVFGEAWWRATEPSTTLLATSLRLVAPNGETWAQPPDDNPFSPMHTSVEWQVGEVWRQGIALAIPAGTPPGPYDLVLVPYEAGSGRPLEVAGTANAPRLAAAQGVVLGSVTVERPRTPPPTRDAVARFGPLALITAESAATTLSPGDGLAVDLLWQAREAPGEPYVVVVQLLDPRGAVVAGVESQPVSGGYPTTRWTAAELVRDRHYLTLPPAIEDGEYSLILGLYRGSDSRRLTTRTGLFSHSDHWRIKDIAIR